MLLYKVDHLSFNHFDYYKNMLPLLDHYAPPPPPHLVNH